MHAAFSEREFAMAGLDPALRRVLVLNGAAAGEGAFGLLAALDGAAVLALREVPGRGAAEHFATLAREVLHESGWPDGPEAIVAVAGPGSFTGLRAALSLAAGLSMGYGCPGVAVTLGAALREMDGAAGAACLTIARRGRCFVDDGLNAPYAAAPEEVVLPAGVTVVTGDALGWLDPERFAGVRRLGVTRPDARAILSAARRGPLLPLQPLYVDPPEARLPEGGLRPVPV
ncbi:hypothetical protein AA0498_1769 [Acidomonas methanolica]|nr:hypothetical protein AA0498_1769 [Acidomonas methanolica]